MTLAQNRNVSEAELFEMMGRLYVSWELSKREAGQIRQVLGQTQAELQRAQTDLAALMAIDKEAVAG